MTNDTTKIARETVFFPHASLVSALPLTALLDAVVSWCMNIDRGFVNAVAMN